MNWTGLMQSVADAVAGGRVSWELRQNPHMARAIAREAGISTSELMSLAAAGRGVSRLQERMMAAYGIHPEELSGSALGAIRCAGITCTHCGSKRRCATPRSRPSRPMRT
jgi:hypothetical protein